jgi:hypothetical protein
MSVEIRMFYQKNLPGWERALRISVGAVAIPAGVFGLGFNAVGFAVSSMGIVAVLTALFGFARLAPWSEENWTRHPPKGESGDPQEAIADAVHRIDRRRPRR